MRSLRAEEIKNVTITLVGSAAIRLQFIIVYSFAQKKKKGTISKSNVEDNSKHKPVLFFD